MTTLRARIAFAAAIVVVALVASPAAGSTDGAASRARRHIKHVFVVNLENKGFDNSFGPGSPAPYLSTRLTAKGQLLTQYYGIGHFSLPNYLAQISGQGPNPDTQTDCQTYSEFAATGTVAPHQVVGRGCVYPASVKTIGNQLTAAGRTWKGYMEDMGTPCRHPEIGTHDETQHARVGDQYAARHNPFVYFHSIIDSRSCAKHVVDLHELRGDLRYYRSTPNLVYITPNLCNDGHDAPCVDGRPGGLVSADAWLQRWIPRILDSPAYKRDGLLIVTFDESSSDASACCGEVPGPNAADPGLFGPGGGRTGAVLISRFVARGSTNDTPYNHYGLLCSIEDIFHLRHLGYAGRPGLTCFGPDVYNGVRPRT